MPLLSMLRKGLKRRCGAPKRKVPVTRKLMVEVYIRGELALDTYDGALTRFAILVGFYFLLRSSEYLRKGGEVDQQKCLRWRSITWAINNSTDDAPPGLDCGEVAVFHEFSKNDFLGQGTENNIRTMKEAAPELGFDPRVLSSHSLRAGGCTAMFNAKFADHEIQRRGRWVSNCWKIYAWSSRRRDNDCADRMTEVDVDLFATMRGMSIALTRGGGRLRTPPRGVLVKPGPFVASRRHDLAT